MTNTEFLYHTIQPKVKIEEGEGTVIVVDLPHKVTSVLWLFLESIFIN